MGGRRKGRRNRTEGARSAKRRECAVQEDGFGVLRVDKIWRVEMKKKKALVAMREGRPPHPRFQC